MSLAVASATPSVLAQLKPKDTTVRMTVVTTFPKPMTLEEWESRKRDLVDPRFEALFIEMYRAGEILEEKKFFHGTSAVWEVEFKNMLASEKWIGEIEQFGLVRNSLCRERGFRIESYLS